MSNIVTDLPMTEWVIQYNGTGSLVEQSVNAAYFTAEYNSVFVEFKDGAHKVVLAVQREAVLSIARQDAQ